MHCIVCVLCRQHIPTVQYIPFYVPTTIYSTSNTYFMGNKFVLFFIKISENILYFAYFIILFSFKWMMAGWVCCCAYVYENVLWDELSGIINMFYLE